MENIDAPFIRELRIRLDTIADIGKLVQHQIADALEKYVAGIVTHLFPNAAKLRVRGEWDDFEAGCVLRPLAVVDAEDAVLCDDGSLSEAWDALLDHTVPYLDWLIEITGDDWRGLGELTVSKEGANT